MYILIKFAIFGVNYKYESFTDQSDLHLYASHVPPSLATQSTQTELKHVESFLNENFCNVVRPVEECLKIIKEKVIQELNLF